MAMLGFSLNNLSLFGLVLAIGIVVDDAIVVVENVERNIELGLTPVEATKKAMNEVSGPVIAVALVLCVGMAMAATTVETGLAGVLGRVEAATDAVVARQRPVQNCEDGSIEVADGKCCPKDHRQFLQGDCYAPCDDGSDDLFLGSYVGCRSRCDPGIMSSVNSCWNGPLRSLREDSARESVRHTLQLPKPKGAARTRCPKGFVKVAYIRDAFDGWRGGCCPSAKPQLIGRQCFERCADGQDDIAISDYVGCRAHCPAGYAEDHNECKKGDETIEREDFPRWGVDPERRRKGKGKGTGDVDADGCEDDWVAAGDSNCCPVNRPVLIGLLCYERCSAGYEDTHFGCRRKCPRGYTEHVLTCTSKSGHHTIKRDGYERHPRASKRRQKDQADSAASSAAVAQASGGTA